MKVALTRLLLTCVTATVLQGCMTLSHEVLIENPDTLSTLVSAEKFDATAQLSFDPHDDRLATYTFHLSHACSAHSFHVDIGPVAGQSLESLLGAAFDSVSAEGTEGAAFRFVVDPVFTEAEITSVLTGGFRVDMKATVELELNARVYDGDGALIHENVLRSSGFGRQISHSCGKGAEAVAEASRNALQEVITRFRDTVVSPVLVSGSPGQSN